jgi:hypothetical protein
MASGSGALRPINQEAAVSDDELIELAIEPIEIPREREPMPAPIPAYSLAAPRPRSVAPPSVTLRDLRAAGVGAALVGLAIALTAWFASPAPRAS